MLVYSPDLFTNQCLPTDQRPINAQFGLIKIDWLFRLTSVSSCYYYPHYESLVNFTGFVNSIPVDRDVWHTYGMLWSLSLLKGVVMCHFCLLFIGAAIIVNNYHVYPCFDVVSFVKCSINFQILHKKLYSWAKLQWLICETTDQQQKKCGIFITIDRVVHTCVLL